MEDNILKSTKKILSVPPDYDAFDHDIATGINSAFATLQQLGVGLEDPRLPDEGGSWDDLELSPNMLSLVQAYVYLKARKFFDPPATSFHIEAVNEQIQEHEFRIGVLRDEELAAVSNG